MIFNGRYKIYTVSETRFSFNYRKKKTYSGAYVRCIEFQSFSCFSHLPNVRDENKWHIYVRKESSCFSNILFELSGMLMLTSITLFPCPFFVITYKFSGFVPIRTGCIPLLLTFTKLEEINNCVNYKFLFIHHNCSHGFSWNVENISDRQDTRCFVVHIHLQCFQISK